MPASGELSGHFFGSGIDSSGGPARNVRRKSDSSGFPSASIQSRSTTSRYDLPASSTGPNISRGLSPRLIRPGIDQEREPLAVRRPELFFKLEERRVHRLVGREVDQLEMAISLAAAHRR